MSTFSYNAYRPLATPAQLLSWAFAPIIALKHFMDRLNEAQDMMDELHRERRYREAVGKDCFNR